MTTVETIDDTQWWNDMVSALGTLEFSAEDKNEVWRLLAMVLHLGNVLREGRTDDAAGGAETQRGDGKAAHKLLDGFRVGDPRLDVGDRCGGRWLGPELKASVRRDS